MDGMAKGQLSFKCPKELEAKIKAETKRLGFDRDAETIRWIVVKYFEVR